MTEQLSLIKSPMKSMTLWGVIIAWIGVKLQVALAPYSIPPETVKSITDLLTEGGMLMAVIGRAIATKRIQS